MKASFPLSINVVAHSSSENRFESAAGWKGVAAKGDSLGIVICAIGNTHLLLTMCLHCQPQTHLLLCKAKFDTENSIWHEGPYVYSSVCLSFRLSGFSSKCNHTCLSTPVSWSRCRELLRGLGCGSACKSAVFSYSKWELWLDRRTHACWSELAGGSWQAVCCFSLVWFGMVGLGLVCTSLLWPHQWFSQAVLRKWTDTTDSAALSSGYDHQTHTHANTLFCPDYIAYCMGLLIRRCTLISCRLSVCTLLQNTHSAVLSSPPSFPCSLCLWCCSYSKKDTVLHAHQINCQAPWWSHQSSYSAVDFTHAGVGSADLAVRPVPLDQQAMT